jgi:hypothetical protein
MNNNSKNLIKEILVSGKPEEKQFLFGFSVNDDDNKILKKFKLFSKTNYPRYFTHKSSPEHDVMIINYIKSYKGQCNGIEIAFRGFAKTSILKLFIAFVILNDKENFRKYLKILAKDLKNSKQMVTDIYNLMVEVRDIYGNIFENKTDLKREEQMGSFTTNKGVKLTAGTVGQTQRGHIQDAYRPDWLLFEDIEDRDSVSSVVITEGIRDKIDEAIQGLAFGGTYQVNANYISDVANVQWFLDKKGINAHIVPITTPNGTPNWDRYTPEIIAKLKADSDDFEGEYNCNPSSMQNKFFDVARVNTDLSQAVEPVRKAGFVRYWKDYFPAHRYGIGEDLSDGIGKDSCALALFNFSTGELVATADDNEIAPDIFTYEVVRVGQEFGNCILAPEINNSCGGIALRVIQEKNYPNIYRKEVFDNVGNKLSNKLGWHTNSKTKPDMFYEFKKDYEQGLIKIYDARVLKEMKMFTKADIRDSSTQSVTRHFDLLTSVVIAYQMKDHATNGTSVKDFYSNLKGGKRLVAN